MPRNSRGDAAGDRAGEAPSADGVAYNPADASDWSGSVDPGNVKKALDQLAMAAGSAHKDSHDPDDGSDALDTAAPAELVGVQAAGVGTSHSLARADHVHQIQHGITDNHLVTVAGTPSANNYARFTAQGIQGRNYAAVRSDINVADGADKTGDNPPQAHTHDGDTLQFDAVTSDGGAFTFTTSGTVTFSQALQIALDKKVCFGDTDVYIVSDDDGDADFIADGTITVAGTTDTVIGVVGDIEIGDGTERTMKPHTNQKVNLGATGNYYNEICGTNLRLLEKSADPTEPAEGTAVIWMSDGTGKGDDGDVMIASQAGGVTKYATLFDHSAGAAW